MTLRAAGRNTGILLRDSQTQRSIRLLDLGRTKTAFVVLARDTPDRGQNLQKAATRWPYFSADTD